MLSVRVENLNQTLTAIESRGSALPFVKAMAINTVARKLKERVLVEFTQQFDKPTPVTMKSLFTRPADYKKQSDPFAEVLVKDEQLGKIAGRSLATVLGHQFSGGPRIAKRSEQLLRQQRYLESDEFLAPGPDARIDPYGNISRGQMQQILTALRANFDSTKNRSQSRRSRRNATRSGNIFYSSGKPGSGQKHVPRRGIWASDGKGNLRLLLVIIKTPKYKQRIDLDKLYQETAEQHWQDAVNAAWEKAAR